MTTLSSFNDLFKEYMHVNALDEADYKKYFLICRYSHKVSKRLLNERKKLLKKGEELFAKRLKEMIEAPNQLLNLIEKDSNWGGGCYHQPVILGLEHGVTFVSEDK